MALLFTVRGRQLIRKERGKSGVCPHEAGSRAIAEVGRVQEKRRPHLKCLGHAILPGAKPGGDAVENLKQHDFQGKARFAQGVGNTDILPEW